MLVYAVVLILISRHSRFQREWLMFLGLAAIFYIIEDFRVGPSSDLYKYAEIFVVIPQVIWQYLWLLLVIWMTYIDFKKLFFSTNPNIKRSDNL